MSGPDEAERIRVLYSFPHTIGKPGIATTALQQVRGLVRAGADVRLYCTHVAAEIAGPTDTVETLTIAGRRVPHRALGVQRAYAFHDWRVARALPRLARDVDVVHCWPAGCLRTLRAAKRLGVAGLREAPSAHTAAAFEDAAAEAAAIGVPLPPGHHHRFDPDLLERELAEFEAADVILAPSDYVAETFLARGFPQERLARHRYGYDPERFSPAAEPPPERPLTALFVGRCEPNKGLHHALRAWIASGAGRHGRFVICGTFLPAYRDYLADELAHPSVEIRGFVDDVAQVMREADVLVLASMTEGSALVTYEAQGCGCVLVVSDAAGAECEHLVHGLVHRAGDVAALTSHFALLAQDRALLARLRAATLARRDELTWDAAARRLVEIYRAAAGGSVASGAVRTAV